MSMVKASTGLLHQRSEVYRAAAAAKRSVMRQQTNIRMAAWKVPKSEGCGLSGVFWNPSDPSPQWMGNHKMPLY